MLSPCPLSSCLRSLLSQTSWPPGVGGAGGLWGHLKGGDETLLTLQTGPSPPNRTELVGELLLVPSSQDVPDKDGAPGQHDGTGFRKSTNTLGVPVDGWSHLHIFTLRGHCHCPGCLTCSPLKVIQTNKQTNTPNSENLFCHRYPKYNSRSHTCPQRRQPQCAASCSLLRDFHRLLASDKVVAVLLRAQSAGRGTFLAGLRAPGWLTNQVQMQENKTQRTLAIRLTSGLPVSPHLESS